MESATIVRLAQIREIPVCCMKYITDRADAELPDINPFIDPMGQMRMLGFVSHVAIRPRYWGSLAQLGKTSKKGADYLASGILNFLFNPQRDISVVNETGYIPDW
jgi:adenosylhomocysteine nucleosidase